MNLPRALILLLGLPGLSLAQVCTEIEDDAERLACYDTRSKASSPAPAEQQVQPATAEAPAPEPAATATAETPAQESAAPEEFGRKEPLDAPREYIEATIVEIATSGEVDYLRLDNGQVWREVEDSRMRFKEGRKVTITEGVLSSYDLKMEGYNNIIKVRRVR